MIVNIYKIEVSLNGRSNLEEVLDANIIVQEKGVKVVNRIYTELFTEIYDTPVVIYLRYRELGSKYKDN